VRTCHQHHIDVIRRHRKGQRVGLAEAAQRLEMLQRIDQRHRSSCTRPAHEVFNAEHVDVMLEGAPSVRMQQELSVLGIEGLAQPRLKRTQLFFRGRNLRQRVFPEPINIHLGNLLLDEVDDHQFPFPVQFRSPW